MPTKTDPGNSEKTDQQGNSSPNFRTTQTSARKYFARDQVRNYQLDNNDVISNAEHVVEYAAGLKSTAMVGAAAAASARATLASVRAELTDSPASSTPDGALRQFTREDLEFAQSSEIRKIQDSIASNTDSLRSRIASTSTDAVQLSNDMMLKKKEQSRLSTTNSAIPEIDHVSIQINKNKGATDCFFARMVFNIPNDRLVKGEIKGIRIFRSETYNPTFTREISRLSFHGVDRIMSLKTRSRSKMGGDETIGQLEHRLYESGVDNSVSALTPIVVGRKTRTGAVQGSSALNIPDPSKDPSPNIEDRNKQDLSSFVYPDGLGQMDHSVARDLKTIQNITRQNPGLALSDVGGIVSAGRQSSTDPEGVGNEQLRQMKLGVDGRSITVNPNNRLEFREIAFLSPDKLSNRIIGLGARALVEFSYTDDTISFGHGYRYYVTTVDNQLVESSRSRIVKVVIDGLRIPPPPSAVSTTVSTRSIGIVIASDDKLVEKFEVFRREDDQGITKVSSISATIISGDDGFTTGEMDRTILPNGFLHIGDSLNHEVAGSTFVDSDVLKGRTYTYRIYTVDIFGNKSESPKEFTVFVPDPELKTVSLLKPSILLEVDGSTQLAKVTFRCSDPRVTSLFLSRRDLTIGQEAFTIPGQTSRLMMGFARGLPSLRFEGELMRSTETQVPWSGLFSNDGTERVFIDQTVQSDHIYQYSVYGMDRYGNKTSHDFSKPVQMVTRPMINAPLNLSIELVPGPAFTVSGITVRWDDGNQDISAEDRIGDRQTLRNTNVRTLFQVERRRIGEERWRQFPLQEDTALFDQVENDSEAPRFRPPYLTPEEAYAYRVQSVQTGGFISNFSDQIQIRVTTPVQVPTNFRIKTCDSKIRPFYAMLNWDTPNNSGIVDSWEIERVVVNNFAAARLNLKNPADFNSLNFQGFKQVYRESSRFKSTTSDDSLDNSPKFAAGDIITGEHHFMDTELVFGNTYFYRIRTVSTVGQKSRWVYRGVKITDGTFEKKQDLILSQDEKSRLMNSFDQISLKLDFVSDQDSKSMNSFGLLADANRPIKPPEASRPDPTDVSGTVLRPTVKPTYQAVRQGSDGTKADGSVPSTPSLADIIHGGN
jgi:hypothetical protein